MLGALGISISTFWLIAVPFFSGLLLSVFLPEYRRSVSTIFISGFLLQASIFECISVACMMFINPRYKPFYICSRIFVFCMLVVSAAGVFTAFIRLKKQAHLKAESSFKVKYTAESAFYLILFILILAFQLYMAVSRSSFDGDDAYYVVQSLQAQTTGTMYRYNPYIGYNTPIDVRHALAMFPIWSAFTAYVSGIHSTIFAHTVLPVFIIPFTYLVYFEIANVIFRKKRTLIPLFMCVISVYQMFGSVSIYTSETFFLTRTWQGKSVLANIALPLVIWIFCMIFEDNSAKEGTEKINKDISPWILTALTNFFAGMATSMGVMLVGISVGILTLALVLYTKRLRFILYSLLAELPAVFYVILYLTL